MLTAFVMIHTEPGRIAEIAQAVANLPHVAEVYSVTGEFDILAIVRLPEYDQLAEVVPSELAKIDGIRRTNTFLAFRRFSAEDLKAAWDIGLS
jgi:DNA-binding Lrp family transcriptional regulator